MSCLISASIFEVLMRQEKLDAPLSYFFIGKKILFVAYETFSSLPMELSVCCDGTSGSLLWL